jgi:ABC-type dipeptide/oligopeptide/nickel transport system permease subunit
LFFLWQWAAFVSISIGVIGILSAYLSKKIEWGWMKIAQFMGYIVPNILLSIVFYLFLYPISLVSKLFSKDSLMLLNNYESYFININKEIEKSSFKKIW